jgi:hypothetical protein
MAVAITSTMLWGVTECGLVEDYRLSGGTDRLHLKGRKVIKKQQTEGIGFLSFPS